MELKLGDECICIHPDAMGMECTLIDWIENDGSIVSIGGNLFKATKSGWRLKSGESEGFCIPQYLIKKPKPPAELKSKEQEREHA